MRIPRSRLLAPSILATLALMAAACGAGGSDQRMAAVEGRLALLEGRMVAVENGGGEAAVADGPSAGDAKVDLGLALDAVALQEKLDAEGNVAVEVVGLDLDPVVDLITATVRPLEGSEDDVAWESAKALAPLFTDLGDYAPALDLRVGDTRCVCSTALMKGIAAGTTARGDWTPACST